MTFARRGVIDSLVLWIAQGFGIGRIPFAPGTFGSLLGFAWFFLLLSFKNPLYYTLGGIFGIGVSIGCANRAEKILGKLDPGSVVIDEIIAIPFCFLAPVLSAANSGKFYHPGVLAAVFVAFRFFDILKPWPINRSQKLPGGWGITIDDLLAAGYVNLIWLIPIW